MPTRTEIVTAMSNEVCRKADELKGGHIITKGTRVVQYSGGYTNVFPFIDKNGKKVAVRCWCADIDNAQERCYQISEYLKKDKSRYFVNFQYVKDALLIAGTLHPVVIMDWVEGQTLKKYIDGRKPSRQLFLGLADKFMEMVKYLHSKNISHGDLQHGNIMVRPDGSLVLIDYDSMYVDSLKGMPDVIKGLPGYQHPARISNRFLTPKLDYFSELVIYLSLHIFAENPNLWQDYTDTEDLLFSEADFADLKQSALYKRYGNSSNRQIKLLLNELLKMLSHNDINDLCPLEQMMEQTASSNLFYSTHTPIQTFDTKSVIDKLDVLMKAIEINRRIPCFDVKKVIEKLNI